MRKEIVEENIKITLHQQKDVDLSQPHPDVSKTMGTFYNPEMKIHRDSSLIVLKTYFKNFHRKISFCDPMVASGIREARYLQQMPEMFSSLILGDISQTSLGLCKEIFKKNSIDDSHCVYLKGKAQETLHYKSVDCIEIDPFGSPAPFLDDAISQVHHRGLLCITATDTASLCGVYPKKAKLRYNLNIIKTKCFDELGLRGLIANCQIRAGQFDKELIVKWAFVHKHFYRIFFEVKESKMTSLQSINALKYISWEKESQHMEVFDYLDENKIGPLYTEGLQDKTFLKECISEVSIVENNTQIHKLLEKSLQEVESIGYYDLHKLQGFCKSREGVTFKEIIELIISKGFDASLSHCNVRGLKTTMPYNELVNALKCNTNDYK